MKSAIMKSISCGFLAFFFLLAVCSAAFATITPELEWIRTYDSPAHNEDVGRGVTVDGAGNVYVTGHTSRSDLGQSDNIWLRKYDANGNTLWTQTYDSPSQLSDISRSVAVDEVGNVYVTGSEYRDDLSQDNNIWLRKYDTNGNILWTQTYDSPAHSPDIGHGVAVDAAGNVYVTGDEDRSDLGQGTNVWLRKYNTNGNILWTQTYDSPSHLSNIGRDVAVDVAGNTYVTGWENRSDLGQDRNIWLRKYDANGNTLWTQTYDSPAHSYDGGYSVAVDAAGNAYVTGWENRSDLGQERNIWLSKYDANGNTLWTQTHDSPAHNNDECFGVTVDAAGNVYVAGYEDRSDLGQGLNIWLRKYDTNGNTLWTQTYDSPAHDADNGWDVAVDGAGNVYVTGYEYRSDLGQDYNIILLKYSQIPEPGTIAMAVAGALGLMGVVRRKRMKEEG